MDYLKSVKEMELCLRAAGHNSVKAKVQRRNEDKRCTSIIIIPKKNY